MLTGIALGTHECNPSRFIAVKNELIPDQGGSQPPPENPNAFFPPNPRDGGNCYASTTEEPFLAL